MEDYKQYLSEGADDRERDAAKQLLEGLSGLRLEKKVAEVAAERRAWLRRRFWARVAFLAALVVIAGVAFLFFRENGRDKTPKMEQPVLLQPIANDTQPNVSPQKPTVEGKKGNGPIAQNDVPKRLPSPHYSSPNIRGENNEDKAGKALRDKVWYTEYPPMEMEFSENFGKADKLLKSRDFSNAYVQLQRLERKLPENDTLRFLKGYCLMEMGEGAEALAYFAELESNQPSWESRLQWYRGLSQLLTGDQEKALLVFREIASNPSHPFLEQSNKAIRLLK